MAGRGAGQLAPDRGHPLLLGALADGDQPAARDGPRLHLEGAAVGQHQPAGDGAVGRQPLVDGGLHRIGIGQREPAHQAVQRLVAQARAGGRAGGDRELQGAQDRAQRVEPGLDTPLQVGRPGAGAGQGGDQAAPLGRLGVGVERGLRADGADLLRDRREAGDAPRGAARAERSKAAGEEREPPDDGECRYERDVSEAGAGWKGRAQPDRARP